MNLRHVCRSLLLLFYHQSYLQSSNWRNCHHQSYPVIEFRIPSRKLIKSHTFLSRRYVHHVELNVALVQLGTKVSYVATKPWFDGTPLCDYWLLSYEREREDSFMRNRYMFFPLFTRNKYMFFPSFTRDTPLYDYCHLRITVVWYRSLNTCFSF